MYTAGEGLDQSRGKNCEISNFGHFSSFFLGGGGCLTLESMGKYKMCDILKKAARRAKKTKKNKKKTGQNLGLGDKYVVCTRYRLFNVKCSYSV